MAHTYGCIYQSCGAEFHTWDDLVRHQDMPHATGDDLTRAYGAGREAYLEGRHCVPGIDPRIVAMLDGVPVGQPRTVELFREFTLGYTNTVVLELPYGVAS